MHALICAYFIALQLCGVFSFLTAPLDGFGNNIANPSSGQAGGTFSKLSPLTLRYADGFSTAVEQPNARNISNSVFSSPRFSYNKYAVSFFAAAHGQAIAHDMVMTHSNGDSGTINTPVTPCDSHWNAGCRTTVHALTIQRNAIQPGTGTVANNPRVQLNKASGFIDAGFVYGHSAQRAALLRTFSGGKLHADANGLPRNSWNHFMAGHGRVIQSFQRLTGDPRGNENPGLLAVTGLWVLEHNRLCDELAEANPSWSDTELFEEARKRVIAMVQHVTISEYLPVLTGEPLPAYPGYDPGVAAGVYGEFAVAAYRYGHSGINSMYWTIDSSGSFHSRGPILLRDAYFNPEYLDTCGIGDILRGMILQPESAIDVKLVDDVRLYLEGMRLDLAAIDIMRGRDFGVPSYADMRWALGLSRPSSFEDISEDPRVVAALRNAYEDDISAVDLWVGGLAEDPVTNGLVGPTFAAIIRRQFEASRAADRFWYESTGNVDSDGTPYISPELLASIRSTRYSDIMKRNLGPNGIPASVFRVPAPVSLAVSAAGDTDDQPAAQPTPSPNAAPSPGAPPAGSATPTPTAASNSSSGGQAGGSGSNAASTLRSAAAGPFQLTWEPPAAGDTHLTMTVTFAGTGWFSWGIGRSMIDSDIVMMRVQGGSPELVDTWSEANALPGADASQDVQLVSGQESNGESVITFRRALITGDSRDSPISRGGALSIIMAWDPSSDTYGFHGTNWLSGSLDIFTLANETTAGGGISVLEGSNEAYIATYAYHGASMFGVWGLLVPSAVFTVRFAKTNAMWLAYHRWVSLVTATITIPAVGSAIVSVGSATQQAHASVGITLTVIMLLQLLSGATVAHWLQDPATPNLQLFGKTKQVHRFFGWTVLGIGFVQCFLGVSLLLPDLRGAYLGIVAMVCAVFIAALLYREVCVPNTIVQGQSHKLAQSAMQTTTVAMSVADIRRKLREGAQWVIMDGVVVDVGPFMPTHPGGAYLLNRVVGTDVSSLFYGHEQPDQYVSKHRHSRQAYLKLQSLMVGMLQRDDEESAVSWVDMGADNERGPDKWLLVSKRKVTSSRQPVWRLEFASPRTNAVPADQWNITSMGLHMMLMLPTPARPVGGPFHSCLAALRLVQPPENTEPSPWHSASRAYSIVRQDASRNMLMFVKAYEGGLVSPQVAALRVGDAVSMEGPHGLGYLDHEASGTVFAVAQGTCMAAFFDLITHLAARHRVVRSAGPALTSRTTSGLLAAQKTNEAVLPDAPVQNPRGGHVGRARDGHHTWSLNSGGSALQGSDGSNGSAVGDEEANPLATADSRHEIGDSKAVPKPEHRAVGTAGGGQRRPSGQKRSVRAEATMIDDSHELSVRSSASLPLAEGGKTLLGKGNSAGRRGNTEEGLLYQATGTDMHAVEAEEGDADRPTTPPLRQGSEEYDSFGVHPVSPPVNLKSSAAAAVGDGDGATGLAQSSMMTASLPTPSSGDRDQSSDFVIPRDASPGNLPPLHHHPQGFASAQDKGGRVRGGAQGDGRRHSDSRGGGAGNNSSSGSDGAEPLRIDSSTQRAISRPMMVSMPAQSNTLPPLQTRGSAQDMHGSSSPVPFMRLGSGISNNSSAQPMSPAAMSGGRTMVRRPSVAMDGSAQAEEVLDTETHLESAMEGYQHALNQETRSRKRGKGLKIVLLGVFRDCADIFELEWLTRMQAECPDVQVHFIVKSNLDDLPLPPHCTLEPLGARPLMRLLPKKDLHSVIVCGAHSFKHQVVKLFNKSGMPRSSITPV